MQQIRATLMRAWARLDPRLGPQRLDPPRAGRPRDPGGDVSPEEAAALDKPGFAGEALPWLDAVHRFARRLTQDVTAAEDLVQETYLQAYRSWEQFERGSNCRAWLFTICRNTFLKDRERGAARYEVSETDLQSHGSDGSFSFVEQNVAASGSPDDFFKAIIDDELIAAIDALPEDFREVLVLSDLGDLTYAEISTVVEVPVGTVKSRLFRARRLVRESLFAHSSVHTVGSRSAPQRRPQ